MKCPFTNKICLLPKEIIVTELQSNGSKTLNCCQMCGADYLKQLDKSDVESKSVDVISRTDGVTTKQEFVETPEEIPHPPVDKLQNKIDKLEARLQEAIKNEQYETAAHIRDIIQSLLDQYNDKDQ